MPGAKHRLRPVFSFSRMKGMRTIAYVDGHNLYFSCLKGTAYKWLDIEKLLRGIIEESSPGHDLVKIRYFTSPIKGAFARRGQASTDAQAEYGRALRANPRVEVNEGRFSVAGIHAMRHVIPPDHCDRVKIWRIEEKETDVSIAVAMYRDARSGSADQLVLVSNDSDLVPALRTIREDTLVRLGVILPLRQVHSGGSFVRRPSASLEAYAEWTRSYILEAELEHAQLPICVDTKRRPARRPRHW
jgi:uncharacterized LabA/DUF88 family protein